MASEGGGSPVSGGSTAALGAASGAGALPILLKKVAIGNALPVRQRGAYDIATLLARGGMTDDALEHLRTHSPFPDLVDLGVSAEGGSDSLTLQLVFSCAANLAQKLVPLESEHAASMGSLLGRALVASEEDAKLRGYALSAAFNLSSNVALLGGLDAVQGCTAALEALAKRKQSEAEEKAAKQAKQIVANVKTARVKLALEAKRARANK
jgi:hypothetical protein